MCDAFCRVLECCRSRWWGWSYQRGWPLETCRRHAAADAPAFTAARRRRLPESPSSPSVQLALGEASLGAGIIGSVIISSFKTVNGIVP